ATTFLLHCDLVYATESAVFSLPFVNLGISPEAASTYLLPRQLGYPRAAELLLLGERFNAARALELGLINGVVGEETYWEHATTQAEKLAAKPAAAVRATKRLMRGDVAALHGVIDREARQFVELRDSEEARAIFRQFLRRSAGRSGRFARRGIGSIVVTRATKPMTPTTIRSTPVTLSLQDRLDISDLFARYVHTVDSNQADAWVGLFTPDGVFDIPGVMRMEGRDQLRGMVATVAEHGGGKWRHQITNILDRKSTR